MQIGEKYWIRTHYQSQDFATFGIVTFALLRSIADWLLSCHKLTSSCEQHSRNSPQSLVSALHTSKTSLARCRLQLVYQNPRSVLGEALLMLIPHVGVNELSPNWAQSALEQRQFNIHVSLRTTKPRSLAGRRSSQSDPGCSTEFPTVVLIYVHSTKFRIPSP